MKLLRNKKLSMILSMVMIILSFTSVAAFAEENSVKQISPVLLTEENGVSPLTVTPTTPYICQTSFIFSGTTGFEVYSGGDQVSISAVATDMNGNAVSGASIYIELYEYETGNVVATLNIKADGTAKVANGNIVSGRSYRFEYTADKLHMDQQFSIRLVSVVF